MFSTLFRITTRHRGHSDCKAFLFCFCFFGKNALLLHYFLWREAYFACRAGCKVARFFPHVNSAQFFFFFYLEQINTMLQAPGHSSHLHPASVCCKKKKKKTLRNRLHSSGGKPQSEQTDSPQRSEEMHPTLLDCATHLPEHFVFLSL